MAQTKRRKREIRVRKKLHSLSTRGGHFAGWACRQAARRSGRRHKSRKSGYSL